MRPVCTTRYRAVHQSGRAQIPQNPLARNKRRSEPCSRCAARAALDLKTTTTLSTYAQGIRTSPRLQPLHLNALGHGCANLDEDIALGLAFRLAVDHIASPRPMRPVCTTRYRAVHQSGRAQIPQNPLARNKRRSEPCSRCAARAALDLKTTITLSTYAQGIRTSPRLQPLHPNALGHGCANLDEDIALGLAFRLAVDHIASPRPMRPVCRTRYRAVHQSGRAQIPHNPLARNKRRSEPCSRCAARAALDLKTTTTLSTYA